MKPVILGLVFVSAAVLASAASAAEDWNVFSRSARTIYLADVGGVSTVGDDTTIRIARVPLDGAAGDYSHSEEDVALRCAAKQARVVLELEFGPDGAEIDRIENPTAEWEDIAPNSLTSYVQAIACDGARAQGRNAASLKAFIDSGRGR